MKKFLFFSIMLVSLVFNNVYAAKYGKTVDVFKFDISGLKLGMDINQVDNILKNMNGQIQKQSSFDKNEYTNKKEVNTISITDENTIIFIQFTPDLTVSPPKMAVSYVSYKLSNTKENTENLKKAALKKYGAPTMGGGLGSLEWCTNLDKGMFTICSVKGNNAILTYSEFSADLILSTQKYADAIKKYKDAQKAVTPKI